MEEGGKIVIVQREKTRAVLKVEEGPVRNMAASRRWKRQGVILSESDDEDRSSALMLAQ